MKGLLIISSCTIITEWHASQNVWSLRINMLVLLYISVKKMISNKGLFILQRDYTVYNVAYLSLRLVYWWIISLANTSLLKLTKLNLHFQLQGLGLCLFDILIFEPHTYIHSNCSWWLDFVKKVLTSYLRHISINKHEYLLRIWPNFLLDWFRS